MLNQSDSAYLNHRRRLLNIHSSPGKIKSEVHLDRNYVEVRKIKDENRIYKIKSKYKIFLIFFRKRRRTEEGKY